MQQINTPASMTAVSRLYNEVPQAQPSKAILAALITEAFVNGMTAQEALTCDTAAAPAQPQA